MTELQFFKKIVFRDYPRPFAILILNELVGAVLLLIGIGTFVPFLAGLLGGSGMPPGPLADLFEWLGIITWAPAETLSFLLVVVALRIVLDGLRQYIASIIGVNLEKNVKSRMNNAISTSDWETFLNVDHGKYVQCIVGESARARGAVRDLAAAFGTGLLTLLLLVWLALYSTETFGLLVAASILFLYINQRFLKRIRRDSENRIGLTSQMNTKISDTSHMFKTLFAEGLTGTMHAAIATFINAVAVVDRRLAFYSVVVNHYVLLFGLGLVACVSMVHLLFFGTEGPVLLFDLILIQRIASYFSEFQIKRGAMTRQIPSYTACMDMMHMQRVPVRESSTARAKVHLDVGMSVEHVCFSYHGRSPVLENVTFQLPARGLVFFAGPSGGGKTTMVDILLGLLQPEKGGRVLIDGNELGNLDERWWRRSLAYVPQDAFILSGTLRNYLSFGLDDVADHVMWSALERAGAATVVRALPQALETDVRSGGANFSGGERQRLSIARALTRDTRLLVLDEPSSGLDVKTEQALFDSLRVLSMDMLVIVVTHSTDKIHATDRVCWFSDGKVLHRDEGTRLSDLQTHDAVHTPLAEPAAGT